MTTHHGAKSDPGAILTGARPAVDKEKPNGSGSPNPCNRSPRYEQCNMPRHVYPKAAAEPASVLVEAGSFRDRGGWAIDQQSIDQMGSAYLLARPVKGESQAGKSR
ncbi:MAG: hypothetical protein ACQESR_18345 [Planctomycetota bacterium]